MIESVLRLFQKDPMWQSKLKSNVAHITLTEVRQLTHFVNVLAPLADLMEKLQKELGNLGMILPAITEIKSLLADYDALPMGIAAFAETLATVNSLQRVLHQQTSHFSITVGSPFQGRMDNPR